MLKNATSSKLRLRLRVRTCIPREKGGEWTKFFENPKNQEKKSGGYPEKVILGIVRSLKPRFYTRYLGVQDMSFKILKPRKKRPCSTQKLDLKPEI